MPLRMLAEGQFEHHRWGTKRLLARRWDFAVLDFCAILQSGGTLITFPS